MPSNRTLTYSGVQHTWSPCANVLLLRGPSHRNHTKQCEQDLRIQSSVILCGWGEAGEHPESTSLWKCFDNEAICQMALTCEFPFWRHGRFEKGNLWTKLSMFKVLAWSCTLPAGCNWSATKEQLLYRRPVFFRCIRRAQEGYGGLRRENPGAFPDCRPDFPRTMFLHGKSPKVPKPLARIAYHDPP